MAMLSHRHSWSFSLTLLVLPSFLLVGSADDPPVTTYHASVSEVRVTFFADENNRPVETIRKDDFAVVDGGIVVREFRSLARSDETALDVVIVADSSESVAPRFQGMMNDVRALVSQETAASDDNISVVSFGGLQPVVICARDCRSAPAQQSLLAMQAAGATPLFDALMTASGLVLSRRIAGVRPVLILFSDGDDTISKASAQDALHAVIASGALLYSIDLNNTGTLGLGSSLLQRISEMTGGRYFREGSSNVLQSALEDLRASYVVTYRLPNHTVGFHSLRILPKHNLNLRFHCRSGYYYGTGSP